MLWSRFSFSRRIKSPIKTNLLKNNHRNAALWNQIQKKMTSIICLIIFHTVFGKNFLVEVENDQKENKLSSDEKFEAELSNSLEEDTETDMADTDKYTTKTGGNDYTRFGGHTPYARAWTDVVCKDLIILHKHLRWDGFPNYQVDSGRIEDIEKSKESFGLYASFSYRVIQSNCNK